MKLTPYCEECLINGQKRRTDDEAYLAWVKETLDSREEEDSAPYMVYLFNQEYQKRFGSTVSYEAEKKQYNELVLTMEKALQKRIDNAPDPLLESILLARTGNYIDFGALNSVDEKTFLSLFENTEASEEDLETYQKFLLDCEEADTFCLIADNCGEIVLDRMMCSRLQQCFPQITVYVLVRGRAVLNDAMEADALTAGFRKEQIVSNGNGASGTVLKLLSRQAEELVRNASVILAKGQGNYETLSGIHRRMYYAFLCKCPLFMDRFHAEHLKGLFRMEQY